MAENINILEHFEDQREKFNKIISDGIEKNRKGDAFITVTDDNGNVIPDVKIKATQKGHEFRFGANLFMLDELESDEKNDAYKKYFSDVFNMATIPFYWNDLEPKRGEPRYAKDSPKFYRRPAPDLCMEFCEQNGIEPREHALAYEYMFPKWLRDASVEEIKSALEDRYQEMSSRYADKIRTIEVTNEMERESGTTKFYDEPDFVEWCFKLAEKYFPNNQLVINEMTGPCWNDRGRATDKYYAYTEANMLKGARIDAIGMQYHLFYKRENFYNGAKSSVDPENLYKHMDLYSNLGKPLQVTEVTVPAYSWEPEDEQVQADVIEWLYSIWFSHPNVEQIIYWNLIDGYAYLDDPSPENIKASQGDMSIGENYFHGGLLRFDLSPKPAYLRIKELVNERWHTETVAVTDGDGRASFRGFYGQYEIEITANGKTVTRTVDLSSKSENNFSVVI